MQKVIALGFDIGSTSTKLVAIDNDKTITWSKIEPSNPRIEIQVKALMDEIRSQFSFSESIPIIATGYGRNLVSQAHKAVTEISCHAKGVFQELGHGGTLVDIGGQDSKVISISPEGKVLDFIMNDKCAAGTGRFLENTANRLGLEIDKIGFEALSSKNEVPISSTCTIFAESEIISLIAHGAELPHILKGLHRSLIKRIYSMIRSIRLVPPLILSGGVVQNPAVQTILEEESGQKLILPKHPQLMGAFGAALLTADL